MSSQLRKWPCCARPGQGARARRPSSARKTRVRQRATRPRGSALCWPTCRALGAPRHRGRAVRGSKCSLDGRPGPHCESPRPLSPTPPRPFLFQAPRRGGWAARFMNRRTSLLSLKGKCRCWSGRVEREGKKGVGAVLRPYFCPDPPMPRRCAVSVLSWLVCDGQGSKCRVGRRKMKVNARKHNFSLEGEEQSS